MGGGGIPYELLEWDLIKTTGWTLEELDRQDMARILPMIELANIRDSLKEVGQYLTTFGQSRPSDAAWRTWKEVMGNRPSRPEYTLIED